MRRRHWIAACLLAAAACEESRNECAQPCIGQSTLRLRKAEWADGEHELIVRYPRSGGTHETRCRFELPRSERPSTCDDENVHDAQAVGISVDEAVSLHFRGHQRGDIELELIPPEGESQTKVVRPDYGSMLVCGRSCVTGDEVVDVDE